MAVAELITEKDLVALGLSREIPEGGYAGCPYDPKRASHAWLCWQAAEHLDRAGLPVELFGDYGLVGAA